MEDPSERITARRVVDWLADACDVTILEFIVGDPDEPESFELEAFSERTGERWRVCADHLSDATAILANVMGVDLEE